MLQTIRRCFVSSAPGPSFFLGIPRSVRPSFRQVSLRAVALAFLATVAVPPSQALAQSAESGGYERTYTIEADAALLPDGRTISPAFVTLDKGVITMISTSAPQERRTVFGSQKPNIIKVAGTLAPAVVDAWSGLPMSGRDGGRRPLPQSRLADDLPVLLPGADAALAARVEALRSAGVGFAYLGRTDGSLQRGLGLVSGFSVGNLPYAIGRDWLDLSGVLGTFVATPPPPAQRGPRGSGRGGFRGRGNPAPEPNVRSSAAIQLRAQELRDLFGSAVALRESRSDHEEAMEKYQEALEKYETDFAKYLEENGDKPAPKPTPKPSDGETTGGGGSRGGGAGRGRGRGGRGGAFLAQEPADAKAADKRPTRPKRPAEPKPSVATDLVLEAMDGKLSVRIEANNTQVVAAALDLAKEHSLHLLIAGGAGASVHAEAMADLGVGVVLDLSRQLANDGKLAADFKAYLDAGVSVALGSGGRDLGPMLLTLAGELIADGVEQDAVWKSLTSTPAELLGLGGKAGAVQRGASGSMILFGGASPFDASAPFRTHSPK
jgi:hypothetical protein